MIQGWKRNTIVFLASQAVSIMGSSLVQYALTWHITLTTKSGAYTALSIIFGFVPTLLLSPFAGVWADRYDRKRLIALADGGIALATLILAMLFLSGQQSLWLFFVAMAVRAFGGAVQQPCINAMLPEIVPTEHLTRVNGINGSVQSMIMLISPMLSGALLEFMPLYAILLIDVVTAGIAICLMLGFLKLPERERTAATSSNYLKEMKDGFSYILKSPFLRVFFGFCTAFWLTTGPVAFLSPLQVARNYGDQYWRLSTIEVAFSVGMLVGGILISVWGGFKNRIVTTGVGSIIMSVFTCLLGLPLRFAVYTAFMVLIGLMMPFFNTPIIVLLQEKVDENYMGRVFSIMSMLSSSLMPLSMVAFGPLADKVPIEYLLLFTGGVMLITSILLLRNKTLLKSGAAPLPTEIA